MDPTARGDALETLVAASSIRTVRIVAWRDLDDPEAGGSELHADRVASAWAAAGLDVELRTSMVAGEAREATRNGYRVMRWGGRYQVFPQVASEAYRFRERAPTPSSTSGTGCPSSRPLWFRGPRLAILHHVHAEMWRMTLKPAYAAVGDAIERHLAPLAYRTRRSRRCRRPRATRSSSAWACPRDRVHVVEPGVEPRYTPGGRRSDRAARRRGRAPRARQALRPARSTRSSRRRRRARCCAR